AARASSVESTPPEKATTTLSSSRIASSSRVYFASSAASMTSERSGHVGQWRLGPGADVGDHLGRRERAEPAARRQVHPAAQSEEKTGRVEVARPGGVDDGVDRMDADDVHVPATDDDRAALAARERRDLAVLAHLLQRGVEIVGLVERADLDLVLEQDVHVPLDPIE